MSDPRCEECIRGHRPYCFLDPDWKEKVPRIDLSGYRFVTVTKVVRE